MHNPTASTGRGGNARLNFILSFALASLLFMGAKAIAQDIGADLADGTNTAVTIKHVKRPYRVEWTSGGSIAWHYKTAKLNNSNDALISESSDLVNTTRTIAVFKLQTCTIGGVTLTGDEFLAFAAKFGKNNWEADHP
jgi:hypothetical protein